MLSGTTTPTSGIPPVRGIELEGVTAALLFAVVPPSRTTMGGCYVYCMSFTRSTFSGDRGHVCHDLFVLALTSRYSLVPTFGANARGARGAFNVHYASNVLGYCKQFMFCYLTTRGPYKAGVGP